MKTLVTGGAGYIGSHACQVLRKAGHEIAVLDNLFQGHRDAVDPDVPFFEVDLNDRAAVDGALDAFQPDAVMHFASYTLVGESVSHPFKYLGDNVRNGLNLLESMVERGVGKIILSSTANLFDEPEAMPIRETERIVPGSPYGESKAILERFLHWLEVTKGMRYACLRYFNAAGATERLGEDHDPETHLIPIVLEVAEGKREKVVVFGDDYDTPDGSCVRDYIHVHDLAQAHLLALEALDQGSRKYNLGNGAGYSVKQVIETAREVTGREIPYEIGPRRSGDPATLVAGSERLRQELGWEPQYPDLRSIVESAWKWRQAHPGGYAR